MTTALPSSDLCGVCRSSGATNCGHDCTYRGMTCMPHISDEVNQMTSLSLTWQGSTGLREFQFFRQDDTINWLLDDVSAGSSQGNKAAQVVPAVNYPDNHRNCCNPGLLTLDLCSSPASSTGSPPGSPPVEASVVGQAAPVASTVSN